MLAGPMPIANEVEGKLEVLVTDNVELLASVLTATPNLRAKFFANPTRAVGSNLPSAKYWEYGDTDQWWRWRRKVRARLAQAILLEIAQQIKDKKLSSTVNTDAVFEDFFAPIVRVSQQSFSSVFFLSWAAFLAGLGLIGSGVYIAIHPPASGNSTVVASVFGGSGAVSALGAVFTMAKEGIRDAALDHARLRAVLTGFATQLGQLRAVAERPIQEQISNPLDLKPIEKINEDITKSMEAALKMMPSPKAATEGGAREGTKPSSKAATPAGKAKKSPASVKKALTSRRSKPTGS